MITTVTITGADDSVAPQKLVDISAQYPFVEWGILVSRKSIGKPRFPSADWMSKLADLKIANPRLKLSMHLCGAYVREFLVGDGKFITDELQRIHPMFQRIQLNTHGEPHEWNADAVSMFMRVMRQTFILQYDNVNTDLLETLRKNFPEVTNIETLFDMSHGAGIAPSEWPKHLDFVRCGYAGGLGPDNLEREMLRIQDASFQKDVWIDMETKVRTADDSALDIRKVLECLNIASKYVS